jgi:hypothetical protein
MHHILPQKHFSKHMDLKIKEEIEVSNYRAGHMYKIKNMCR